VSHLVLYDGVCGLCDRAVAFLLDHDRDGVLTFAPLQGQTVAELRRRTTLPPELETMLFVEDFGTPNERVSFRSTGVLRMLGRIGGFWRVVSWLRIVPRPIRDLVYRTIARHRYRWFGRFDQCKLPPAEMASRFLD